MGYIYCWYPDTAIYIDRPGVWVRPLPAGTPWVSRHFLFTPLSRRERKGREAFSLLSTGDLLGHLPGCVRECTCNYIQHWQATLTGLPPRVSIRAKGSGVWPKTSAGAEWRVRLQPPLVGETFAFFLRLELMLPPFRHYCHDYKMLDPRRPSEVCDRNWGYNRPHLISFQSTFLSIHHRGSWLPTGVT